MTSYEDFLKEVESFSDEKYLAFHKKLLNNENINVMGVRVPDLRKIAKKYKDCVSEILAFPDEYYEVVFIKLTIVSNLKYEEFLKYIDYCVSVIDNWATCDCFVPKCLKSHKKEFLLYVEKYFSVGQEFYQRFALTTLLHFYVDEEYLELIYAYCDRANTEYYYVHMAVAWLVAETAVKYYDRAVQYLNKRTLDKKTHNKAIQKAIESFRLSVEQKNFLKGIKK